MNLNGAFALIIATLLITPGYIMLAVANRISPRYSGKQLESLVLSMAYGSVILFCFLHLWCHDLTQYGIDPTKINLNPGSISFDAIRGIVNVECTLFFMAVVMGALLGAIRRANCFGMLLQTVGVSTNQSSWDYMFERAVKAKEARWIIIRCKDGSTVQGEFYSSSHASMASDGIREIYLEKAYYSDQPDWSEEEGTEGVYVRCEDILWLKMYHGDKEQEQEQPVD